MTIEPKPCPFCGSSQYSDVWDTRDGSVFVVCDLCGAAGPISDMGWPYAVELWNHRQSQMRTRLELSREGQNFGGESWRAVLKLMEEVGELAEAILIDYGSLQYKGKQSDTIGELADIINAVAAIKASHYKDMSVDEIIDASDEAAVRKLDKYRRVLESKKKQ